MIKEIKSVQSFLENKELDEQRTVDEEAFKYYQRSPELAKKFLTEYCMDNAHEVLAEWKELAYRLIVKFNPASVEFPLPSEEWREALKERNRD